jgi:serine O-acetyltransferase
MDQAFYKQIFDKQQSVEAVPSNEKIASWVFQLISLLYPERAAALFASAENIANHFAELEKELVELFHATGACKGNDNGQKAKLFFNIIPDLYRVLNTDIDAILSGDPAAHTRFEIIRAYPGFLAISFYRIAHALHLLGIPVIPRIITEHAHSKTGIDIHPAAKIGEHFFIDHGTGIVVGETCVIGDHVKLYQGVTLGALSVDKSMVSTRRHPTVESHVIIYSGATILGGDTVIGHHSIIGGNVWLTRSIRPHSTVYHKGDIEVVEQTKQ